MVDLTVKWCHAPNTIAGEILYVYMIYKEPNAYSGVMLQIHYIAGKILNNFSKELTV